MGGCVSSQKDEPVEQAVHCKHISDNSFLAEREEPVDDADYYGRWESFPEALGTCQAICICWFRIPRSTDEDLQHHVVVFQIRNEDGKVTYFTCEQDPFGRRMRWGHHTNYIDINQIKAINHTVDSIKEICNAEEEHINSQAYCASILQKFVS